MLPLYKWPVRGIMPIIELFLLSFGCTLPLVKCMLWQYKPHPDVRRSYFGEQHIPEIT